MIMNNYLSRTGREGDIHPETAEKHGRCQSN
jgi:hypothetical protein